MPVLTEPRVYFNPAAPLTFTDTAGSVDGAGSGPLEFHRRLPGYAPTPLVRAANLAAALGVRRAWVKDEANRLGLPAYKVLGASWATYRELGRLVGSFEPWRTVDDLAAQLRGRELTLVAATDGNHGRAVARVAGWLGLNARILVPQDMAPARIHAIMAEGAQVERWPGTYDQAVEAAARLASHQNLVISDTAWDGYSRVPEWVTEGYSTIFSETDAQLAGVGETPPDLVAVQMGVGALATAVVRHYRAPGCAARVVGAEPTQADCVRRSLEAGTPVEVPGPHTSIMAGLNCGNVSPLAWPYLRGGLSASVATTDARAEEAMRLLARDGVVSGESGAAGAAGLLELLTGSFGPQARSALGLTPESSVLVISTEGATDPDAYARITGTA